MATSRAILTQALRSRPADVIRVGFGDEIVELAPGRPPSGRSPSSEGTMAQATLLVKGGM